MHRNVRGAADRLDRASGIVIGLTFVLFAGSLFVKGLTHDIFLEGGVLLVSIKLILTTRKMDAHVTKLDERIGQVLAHLGPRGEAPAASPPPRS
ncbi:MAG TPA: hypothetical protein VGX97_01615 [bacterium]|nr:hypothetical protein [bacterium]